MTNPATAAVGVLPPRVIRGFIETFCVAALESGPSASSCPRSAAERRLDDVFDDEAQT